MIAKKLIAANTTLESLINKSIQSELDKRVDTLAEILTNELRNPAIKSSESRKAIGLLLRLEFAEQVRNFTENSKKKSSLT